MAGLLRIEIPYLADGAGFIARARYEGELGPVCDDQDGTFSITGANADDTVTFAAEHFLRVGDTLKLTAKSGGSGTALETTYYVKTVESDTVVTLSATDGGSTLNLGSDITSGTAVVLSRWAVIRQMQAALTDTRFGDLTGGPILVVNPGVSYRAI